VSGTRNGHLQGTVWGVEVREREWGERKWKGWQLRAGFHMKESEALHVRDCCRGDARGPGDIECEARVVPFTRRNGRR